MGHLKAGESTCIIHVFCRKLGFENKKTKKTHQSLHRNQAKLNAAITKEEGSEKCIYVYAYQESLNLALSYTTEQCSCRGWCVPRDSTCCCRTQHDRRMGVCPTRGAEPATSFHLTSQRWCQI